jgi:import inner membrane translocase subunit TIM50
MRDMTKVYTDPAHETLLPGPLPHQYQPPYTVIIEMKDILVHSEYDRNEGWRLRKRPGVEYFLRSLAGVYEIVLFTSELPYVAEPVVAKLDPDGIIMYHLFRDSTKYEKGVHIKDLTNLNRDLSRVIIVDTDPKSFCYHSSNGLVLKEWTGEQHDTTLFDLAHFLKTLAEHRVVDVRQVLEHYRSQGGDILATFRINQAKLSEEERKRETEKKSSSGHRWGGIRWTR